MKKTRKQINQRRYYLHWKLRKSGFNILTKSKTILIPYGMANPEEIPHIAELNQRFHYAIQLIIPYA